MRTPPVAAEPSGRIARRALARVARTRTSLGGWARTKTVALTVAGGGGLLAAWMAASLALGVQVVPDPVTVGRVLWADVVSGALPHHLGVTCGRVAAATVLAMALGIAAGVWVGLSRGADAFWAPWLVTGLTVPRLLLIVVAYLLVGLNEVALVAATALATAPGVAVALREGVRALDWKLVDMARAFSVGRYGKWRHVIWPQLLPYAAGSARAALSLGWKIVLFAELLGRPSGVGYQISFYFQMFNMGQILAYGAATVIVAAIVELAMRALERRAYRWRPGLVA